MIVYIYKNDFIGGPIIVSLTLFTKIYKPIKFFLHN